MFFSACKEKDPDPAENRYHLTVLVTDESSRPIQDALVEIGLLQQRTDATGKCAFPDLKIGTLTLKVSAEDYLPVSQSVSLAQASQTETVILTKEPPYLSVDAGQIDTPEMNAKGTIQIRSNTAWRIESSSAALSFSPREGSRDGTVEVTWNFPEEQDNEDLAQAEFTIASAADPVTIPVRWHLPIRITKAEGIVYNQAGAESVPSVARLTFSRKVVPLEAWAPGYTELGIQAVDDHTVDVVIPANFVDLGED